MPKQEPPEGAEPEGGLILFFMQHPEAQDWFYTLSVLRPINGGHSTRYRHMTGRTAWMPHETRSGLFDKIWDLYGLDGDDILIHWSLEPNDRPEARP